MWPYIGTKQNGSQDSGAHAESQRAKKAKNENKYKKKWYVFPSMDKVEKKKPKYTYVDSKNAPFLFLTVVESLHVITEYTQAYADRRGYKMRSVAVFVMKNV